MGIANPEELHMNIICRIPGLFMNIRHDLHFDEGVRVAVRVHGRQMGTSYDPNQQAALLCVIAQ